MLKKDIGRFLIVTFLYSLLKGKKKEFLPPPPPFPELKLEDFEKKEKKIATKKKKPITKPEADETLDKELQEIEQDRMELPEIKEKPKEIVKAEEEIQMAIKSIKHKEKKSIFKGLFKAIEKKPKFKTMKKELPVEFTPRPFEKHEKVEDVLNMVHKAREALMEFDLDKAKGIYIEIMRTYNDLSNEEKEKIYHEIKDLYNERKNAESLNIK